MNQYQLHDDKKKLPLGKVQALGAGGAAPQKRQLNLVVLGMGIASTAITLVLVEIIRGHQIDPMLFFIHFILPIGSFGVGLAAGTGYGLGSWVTQARLSRLALFYLAVLHSMAWAMLYVLAWWHWQAAHHGAGHLGLFAWFDATTQGMIFTDQNGHTGQRIGELGYVVRLGEVAGFVFGGLIIPLMLFAKPYCEKCQRYLKQRALFSLPASAQHRSFVRQKTLDAANAPVRERLAGQLNSLTTAISSGDGTQLGAAVESMAPDTAPNRKIRDWLCVFRHRCPGCGSGFIDYMSKNRSKLKLLQRFPVTGGFIETADEVVARLPQLRQTAKSTGGPSKQGGM